MHRIGVVVVSFRRCLFSLFLAITIEIASAGEFDNCKKFTPIPVRDQNTDSRTLQDLNSRPLGFDSAVIPFNDPAKSNPCFIVSLNDSTAQTVQVMATGVNGSPNICVRSDRPGAQETCVAGLTVCPESALGGTNGIKYVFYCNGCEAPITFWFRFTPSPLFENSNGVDFENWCQSTPSKFPDSLIQLPNEGVTTTRTTSAGSCFVPQTLLWIFTSFCTFCLICSLS